MHRIWAFLLALFAVTAPAQTVYTITQNDAATTLPAASVVKPGENIGTSLPTDNSNGYRNVFGASNWGGEPTTLRNIFAQNINAAANQVVIPPFYTNANAPYPANNWQGATVDITAVPSPYTGAEKGCHATVASNPRYVGLANNAATASFSITSNVVTVISSNVFAAGDAVAISGLSTGTYLNNVLLTITSATSSQFTAAFTHANVASTSDVGTVTAQAVINLSSSCGAATQPGDVFTIYMPPALTPEANWEGSAYLYQGATITGDMTTPGDGAQSWVMDTTPSGSEATYPIYADNDTHDRWHDISGTWLLSIMSKRVSGTGSFLLEIQRNGESSDLCSVTFTPTGTAWVTNTATCTPNEQATRPGAGLLTMRITQYTGSKIEYDDEIFKRTDGRDATNTTVFADETLYDECFFDGNLVNGVCDPNPKQWGMGRGWTTQHGETLANWIAPAGSAAQPGAGDPQNANAYNLSNIPQLPDILRRFQKEHRLPYFPIPMTFTDAEAVALLHYLLTTQAGMTQPWVGPTGIFPIIYLDIGNENWNTGTYGQSLGYRSGTNTIYDDYFNRAGNMIAAMRADSLYNPAIIRFGLNEQGQTTYGITTANGAGSAWARMGAIGGRPDFFNYPGYTENNVSDFRSEALLWAGALQEQYNRFYNSTNLDYQAYAQLAGLNQCGASGTAACGFSTYEWADDTYNTCTTGGAACDGTDRVAITQTALSNIEQGAGQALATAYQALLYMQHGYTPNTFFAISGYGGARSIGFTKIWGNTIDAGGASSALNGHLFGANISPRPAAIGMNLLNSALIGREYPCPTNAPTFNFAGSQNGANPAMNNEPALITACFTDDAGNYSMFVLNIDQANPYTYSFPGTHPPAGAVTVKTLAPSSLNLMNEVLDSSDTSNTVAQVYATTSSLSSPTQDTIPAHAIKVYTYSTGAAPAARAMFVNVGGQVKVVVQ